MAEAHPGDRLPHPARLVRVDVTAPAAALHGAEGAGPGADVAQDHEGGGAGVPAFPEVGAARLLADSDQLLLAHQRGDLGDSGTHRGTDREPRRAPIHALGKEPLPGRPLVGVPGRGGGAADGDERNLLHQLPSRYPTRQVARLPPFGRPNARRTIRAMATVRRPRQRARPDLSGRFGRAGSPSQSPRGASDLTRALPMHIGGLAVEGSGPGLTVSAPHRHAQELGHLQQATVADVEAAVDAALRAGRDWSHTSPRGAGRGLPAGRRAALRTPGATGVNAATILGQSKSVQQAEIDAACELIDFWRFNVHYAFRLREDQPISTTGVWNRTELRPLEGFVVAITPFNFTSIAGNLPTAPALMGNVVVWKPSVTSMLAASAIIELLEEAGLPPGVINMVTGHGAGPLDAAISHPALAGIHFTGSTDTFRGLWRQVAGNLGTYRTYPRLVGETGGKDFVLAHESAAPEALLVGLLRGAFEYQGQKCSAASRAYIPRRLWEELREPLARETEAIPMGDPSDFSNFMGAVIDEPAFRRHEAALKAAAADPALEIVAGGTCDASTGWFVRPSGRASRNRCGISGPSRDVRRGWDYPGPVGAGRPAVRRRGRARLLRLHG